MVTADEQLKDAEHRMAGANLALQRELDSVRTGRARPGLIEHIVVEYYGTDTPLNQLASVSVPEARVLAIQPWDKSAMSAWSGHSRSRTLASRRTTTAPSYGSRCPS